MMSTFDTLQRILLDDLRELQEIRKRGLLTWPMTRVVKEEHVGRCCYLAEELLSSAELCALKQQIGLDEQQWKAYKVKLSGQ